MINLQLAQGFNYQRNSGEWKPQNVRRFTIEQCGTAFKFDRDLMAWIRNGMAKTLGNVAYEW